MASTIREVLAALALVAFTACFGTTRGLAQPASLKTVTIARAAEAPSLDPHQATAAPSVYVYANIFDTLVEQDRDLSLTPSLAESWEQTSPTTWRFKLRRGVTFHDGTPFNAQAVKFTFDRVLNE